MPIDYCEYLNGYRHEPCGVLDIGLLTVNRVGSEKFVCEFWILCYNVTIVTSPFNEIVKVPKYVLVRCT
jgi:hypothetical protein